MGVEGKGEEPSKWAWVMTSTWLFTGAHAMRRLEKLTGSACIARTRSWGGTGGEPFSSNRRNGSNSSLTREPAYALLKRASLCNSFFWEISMRKSLILVGVAGWLLSTSACAGNIIETAQGAGKFATLIAVAQAAGLADALVKGKNLTVFAPTGEAFAKLPAGTVESLLKSENKDKLIAILTYHVLPRVLMSNQLPKGPIHVGMLGAKGDRMLAMSKNTDGVMVDGSHVVKANILADNGVIDVIDTVMLPPK
jgi:uncharacterized surface protein with fasciclin (FAS1) repeats